MLGAGEGEEDPFSLLVLFFVVLLGLIGSLLDSFALTWSELVSHWSRIGLTWAHLLALGLIWSDMCSACCFDLKLFHLLFHFVVTCFPVCCFCIVLMFAFTFVHLLSGKEKGYHHKENGKANAEKEQGKASAAKGKGREHEPKIDTGFETYISRPPVRT